MNLEYLEMTARYLLELSLVPAMTCYLGSKRGVVEGEEEVADAARSSRSGCLDALTTMTQYHNNTPSRFESDSSYGDSNLDSGIVNDQSAEKLPASIIFRALSSPGGTVYVK
jgi:hypothetical protein